MFRAVKHLPPSLRNSRQLLTIAKIGSSYNLEYQPHNLVQQACKTTSSRLCSTKAPDNMSTLAGAAKAARLNRLADEKSTYLLQHSANPVDWYPWGDEAFEKAKNENKLIFLSVGYSTCHWCHVMERESFESEVIAEILNQHYVCIKVDREERPDVDRIYMSFVQRTTGGGGWPMSVFLTPNLAPLYGGTYFPPEDDFGRVGFKNLVKLIAQQWEKERTTLQKEASESVVQLKKVVASKFAMGEEIPKDESWQKCFQQILRSYEVKFGGFSRAPKFPQPSMFNFLFNFYYQNRKTYDGTKAKEMCLHTLERMAYGGIHDHVNCGFARYSVDAEWHTPHFEKMLYDQSQLVNAYLDAYIISKVEFFKEIVDDIITYVCRDLSHFEGGFFGAEDADSYPSSDRTGGKKEGAFCVWEFKELKNLLTQVVDGISDFEVYAHHFNVKPEGNVRSEYDRHAELTHKNVLSCSGSYKETAEEFKLTEEKVKEIISRCNAKLYENRQNRPKPHVDTKIITSWNGLMISGLARAGFHLKSDKYTQRAVKAANFVKKYLYKDNKLFRCCYGDETSVSENVFYRELPILGFLDDYVSMIKGLIDLYESTMDTTWLEWAEELQKVQDDDFWDNTNSGYFSSGYNDETIVIRDKEDQDGAEPCGNSLAVTNLIRLSGYLHRNDLRKKAALILKAFAEHLNKIPIALPEMGAALILYHSEPLQVFIVGKRDVEDTQKLLDVLRSTYIPGKTLALADGPDGGAKLLYSRNKSLAKLRLVEGKSAAYVCRNFACSLPVTDPKALQSSLEAGSKKSTRSESSSSSDSN